MPTPRSSVHWENVDDVDDYNDDANENDSVYNQDRERHGKVYSIINHSFFLSWIQEGQR